MDALDFPRTPKGFLSMIKGRNLEGLLIHDSNQTPHGWLERKLHESEEAWVPLTVYR